MKIPGIVIMVVAFAVLAVGQERFLKPVDEANKDASFLAFRTKLIAAVEKKDVKHILSILDTGITASFGGDEGIADFKTFWKINDKDSAFWDEFLPVIKNGGVFDGEGRNRNSSFTAPYTYGAWPDGLDTHEFFAIFGSDVNLRERPSTDSKVIDQLSYNVVKIDWDASTHRKAGPDETDLEPDWYKVETLGGKKGFVKAEYVRSHYHYRAGFQKKNGVWKMIFFVAGD